MGIAAPRTITLEVAARADGEAWYADGLGFTCTQCGNCCTGPPGYVWVSDDELARLAEHLKLTEREVVRRYARRLGGRLSLNERRNARGQYDCVFLKEEPSGDPDAPGRRSCSIYPVRPLQCRTWPFWPGNLRDPEAWRLASRTCPGMTRGKAGGTVYPPERIESLATAEDWPDRPPSSEPNAGG